MLSELKFAVPLGVVLAVVIFWLWVKYFEPSRF
jgi:hypothetical protein